MTCRPAITRATVPARTALPAVLALCLAVGAAAVAARAADLPAPPSGYFDDRVGLVDDAQTARFAEALAAFGQRTGIQFVVTVLPELDGDVETYTNRLFQSWRIGGKEANRGVLFAVFPRSGQTRIEVGYGLEDSLPDVVSSRILRKMMELPREPAAARFAFVITSVARGDGGRARSGARRDRGIGGIVLFLIIMLLLRGRGGLLGPLIIASALNNRGGGGGWGGFSGGGGGGFSGGGGMSGGGGASGGW